MKHHRPIISQGTFLSLNDIHTIGQSINVTELNKRLSNQPQDASGNNVIGCLYYDKRHPRCQHRYYNGIHCRYQLVGYSIFPGLVYHAISVTSCRFYKCLTQHISLSYSLIIETRSNSLSMSPTKPLFSLE